MKPPPFVGDPERFYRSGENSVLIPPLLVIADSVHGGEEQIGTRRLSTHENHEE